MIMQFCAVLDEGFNRLTAIRHVREQDKQLSEARQVDSVGILAAGVADNFKNILQADMGNIYMAKLNASYEQQRSFIEEHKWRANVPRTLFADLDSQSIPTC